MDEIGQVLKGEQHNSLYDPSNIGQESKHTNWSTGHWFIHMKQNIYCSSFYVGIKEVLVGGKKTNPQCMLKSILWDLNLNLLL